MAVVARCVPESVSQSEFPAVSLCHAKQTLSTDLGKTSSHFSINSEQGSLSLLQFVLCTSNKALRPLV